MELEYYSKYFMYGGIAVSVIATLFFIFCPEWRVRKKQILVSF